MKSLMILLAALVMFSVASVPVVSSADVLIPPMEQLGPRVPLNNYYIGIHEPDGSCQTMQIYASSYDEAIEAVKRSRCDFCALKDMTPYYTSTEPDVISQASKSCPIW